ncbi:MAG: hypothetical protein IKL31_08265 [Ruminococcus sp.]|nr:hypothetical protein [Ruminococcus sp.]
MYLSRIKLNTTLRETIKSLAAPNLIHGAIESCENAKKMKEHENYGELIPLAVKSIC